MGSRHNGPNSIMFIVSVANNSRSFFSVSDPICRLDRNVVVEGANVSMSCELHYRGAWAPVMQWSSPTVDLPAKNLTNDTFIRYTVQFRAEYRMNGYTFRCNTFFNLPKQMPTSNASNVPAYVHEDFVGPLQVLCALRNQHQPRPLLRVSE